MRTINIKESVRKRKVKKIPYFLTVIVSLISTIIFLLVTEKSLAINTIKYIFLDEPREISYITYRVYLEDLGEYYASTIQENLAKVQFQEKNRFSIVNDKKKADIYFTFNNEGNEVSEKHLLPVGHFYWNKGSVSTEDINNFTFSF